MELQNNTILITGGASGLGFEFASQLLALGNTIIITGRNQDKLDETRKKLPGIHKFQSDVSDPQAIAKLTDAVITEFPKLNMLINNAGEMHKISLHYSSIDLHDLTREVEINLMGPMRMIQAFLPHLKKQSAAAIVNVTSGLALIPFPISPIYGASKSGLRSYTQSLRVQLKNTQVKVFELVAPAAKTPLTNRFSGTEGFDEKTLMDPAKLVAAAIKGLQNDKLEIYPGIAKILRIMSRIAPAFLLKQLSKAGANEMAG
jgi:uncharacterized oxidoreductase